MSLKSKLTGCLLAALMTFGCISTAEAAERGEKTFGVRTGYVSRNRSADFGLFFQYSFSEHFRLEPAADLVFRHHDRDAFTIDLNAQVPFDFSDDKFSLYPFAGLNFSSWNYHFKTIYTNGWVPLDDDYTTGVSSRKNRFGINLGAGFDLKVSSTLKLSLQAGYTFVKANSGIRILAGIGYVF